MKTPPPPSSDQMLRAENAELRVRLEEAEEMLRALRAGEVDALVVEGDAGPRLFTLQGLDAEQNRLRGEMLAQVSDAVIAVDTEERVIFLNAAAERQYSVRAGDVLGCPLIEIFTPQWPSPEAEAEMLTALREHGAWRGEVIHRRGDGSELHVESSRAILLDPDTGERIGLVTAIRDITERKRMDQRLREEGHRLRLAMAAAATGMWDWDVPSNQVVWSPECYVIHGVREGEFDGTAAAFDRLVHPDDRGRVWAAVTAAVEQGTLYESEFRIVRPTGEVRWVSNKGRAIGDGAGVSKRMVGTITDITERKQAEAARRLANERLTFAVHCSQVVLWQQDLELRYTWLQNPVPGFEDSHAIGKRDSDLMERAADAAVTEALKREVIRSGVSQRQEVLVQIAGVLRHYDLLVEPQRDTAGLISGITCAAIDITERKQAEEERHEMERNYRALAAASSEVSYRMSADWSTMLPLDGRQLVASSDQPLADWAWLDHNIPIDEHSRIRRTIREAIARKSLFEMEHRVRRPDGSTGWTFSRAVPILDENEEVLAWFGAASDITERKKAEERVRTSEARLRRVFESNVVGMIRWDLERSLILDANAEFLRMTGYVRDDITSGRLNFRDLTPPEWTARNEEGIRAIRANGHAPPYEKAYFHKDGSRLPLIIAGTRFEDSPSEGMSFLIDLTPMKQAEAALRERTALLNGVLESTTDVIYVKDLNGRMLLANAAFGAVGSSTPEQLVGKTDADWYPPDVAAAVRQQDEAVIAGGAPMQFEDTLPVGGDARVFHTLKAPLRDGTGRVVGILGISRDITERKAVDDELRRQKELLRSITDTTTDLVFVKDRDCKLMFANPATLSALGLTESQAIGVDAEALYPDPLQGEAVRANDRRILTTGTAETVEEVHTGPYGTRTYLSLKTPMRDRHGAIVGLVGISHDITMMRQAEQALAERTALLNGVLESTTDVIYVKDLNGRLLLANPAFAAEANSTPEQLVGKTDADWFPPDVAAAVRQQDEAVIAGGAPMEFEDTLPVAGEARVFLTQKAPLRDGSGRVVGILGISRDITERKRTEVAMTRLAVLVESSHDGLFGEDLDGIVTSWNRGAEQIFGYCAEEIIGTSIMRLIPEARQAEEHALQRKLAAGERGGTFEGIRRAKDGREFHASITISPLKDAAGKVIGTSRVVRDITERKQAEAALRANEERMRLATQATEVGIWEWNVHSGFVRWDAQMFQLYGVDPSADGFVSYDTWRCAVLPEDLALQEKMLSDILAGSGKSTREFRIIRRDNGECRWIQAVETVLSNDKGKAEWVIGTNLDVTAQKNAERTIRETAQRKDEFLAMLGHELRNPLNAIRHAVQISGETPDDAEACQWAGNVIDRQSQQLSRMVDDLLDVARINRGRIDLRVETLDLGPVLEQAIAVVRPLLAPRRQTFTSDIGSPLRFTGDAARLQQVFVNLLTNAAKYTPENGHISLRAQNEDGEVVVTITDNGVGIPSDLLPHVFDLFRQADNTLDRALGGLGIGLSVVKSLIEMHLGKVTVESAGANAGTTVTVRLPLIAGLPTPASASIMPAPAEALPRSTRVLVVDDHEDAAQALTRLLKRRGCEVALAHTGPAGVATAREFLPEVLLIDLGLPGFDGYELARLLRAEVPFADALFIAITGYAQEGDRARCLATGFDAHFAKPLDFPRLIEAIRAVADRRTAVPASRSAEP